MVRPGALSRLERHPEQHSVPLAAGRRACDASFAAPARKSNGNTFDFQGRQLSCEHFTRRVVRWEHDGSLTVIADAYDGKRLNSPNDVVPHPDGSIWFTDPPYGDSLYEGQPDEGGLFNPRLGALSMRAGRRGRLPNAVYRVDPSGAGRPHHRRTRLPQWHLLLAGLHETLHLRHRPGPARHQGLRCHGAQHAGEWPGLHGHDGRWREMRAGRDARRCPRQSLVRERRGRERPRLQRRAGLHAGGRNCSGASACRKRARMSASAAPGATGSSWPPASRSTHSTSTPRALHPDNAVGREYRQETPRQEQDKDYILFVSWRPWRLGGCESV